MKVKLHILGSVCALALATALPSAASADILGANWSSTLAGDYTWASWGNGEDVLGLHGATVTPTDWYSVSFQANGDYRYRFGSGAQISSGDLDATLIYPAGDWRLAATGGAKIFPGTTLWHVGLGAEWQAAPDWTVTVKGMDVTNGHDGFVYGGNVSYYWAPDLAFTAQAQRDNFDDETDLGFRAEYQAWNGISLFANYTFNDTATVHAVWFGIKLYCDGDAPSTLVERHRSGPLQYVPGYTNLDWDT